MATWLFRISSVWYIDSDEKFLKNFGDMLNFHALFLAAEVAPPMILRRCASIWPYSCGKTAKWKITPRVQPIGRCGHTLQIEEWMSHSKHYGKSEFRHFTTLRVKAVDLIWKNEGPLTAEPDGRCGGPSLENLCYILASELILGPQCSRRRVEIP